MNVVGAASRGHRNERQKLCSTIDDDDESARKSGEHSLEGSVKGDVDFGEKVENAHTEKYNEDEDRLFTFPPPSYRKRDRQLRVLMSRYDCITYCLRIYMRSSS